MDLKKSLFGGYKKASVDAVMKQMQETEEQAQAKISLLENEYRLSKENAQKNMESIQTESMIRQKSLVELTRAIEEKNGRLAELEAKQETLSTDIEDQLRTIVSELETKHNTKIALLEKSHAAAVSSLEESSNTKIAFLENKYNTKVAELEERYQRDVGAVRQNDEQVKRIGQLYVDAQEYTEKMKQEAKVKTMESVDQIFEEIFKAQEQYEASIKEIGLKNQSMKQMAGDMIETIQILQTKVENIEREQGNITSPFENIKSVKERIRQQINSQYDKENEKHATQPVQKNNEPAEKIVPEEKPVVQAPVEKPAQSTPVVDYALQLAELKQRIERQEELLSMRGIKVTVAETSPPSFHAEEVKSIREEGPAPIEAYTEAAENDVPVSTSSDDDSAENTTPPEIPGYETQSMTETEEKSDVLSEKERFDRESYSKYFAEIGKRFSKEQPISTHTTDSSENPSDISTMEEPEKSEEKKEPAEDTENTLPKKPSIKDILNKYANLK